MFISGRLLEDFNVYGIHGAGAGGDISDSPPDGPDDISFPAAGPSQRYITKQKFFRICNSYSIYALRLKDVSEFD